jgi:GT2 family glycosyltransferase
MVYIILLNWNGWKDTIECLESVFRLQSVPFRVILCDTGSEDGSLEYIRAWANGKLDVYVPRTSVLRALSFPPISKPIRFTECDPFKPTRAETDKESPLIILSNGADLGFAAGNNTGIRYALAQPDMKYVWLLNNDTVVDSLALQALMDRARAQPLPGICGSTIRYYFAPERVQALGGAVIDGWRARCHTIGYRTEAQAHVDVAGIEKQIDFIMGASMLVSRAFLEDVGLMNEIYFLYAEEADWVTRAQGRYPLGFAPGSIVYHRDGGATEGGQSAFAQFHWTRSWLIFIRTYYPARLPVILLSFILSMLKRAMIGNSANARAILRAISTTPLWQKQIVPGSLPLTRSSQPLESD